MPLVAARASAAPPRRRSPPSPVDCGVELQGGAARDGNSGRGDPRRYISATRAVEGAVGCVGPEIRAFGRRFSTALRHRATSSRRPGGRAPSTHVFGSERAAACEVRPLSTAGGTGHPAGAVRVAARGVAMFLLVYVGGEVRGNGPPSARPRGQPLGIPLTRSLVRIAAEIPPRCFPA